MLIKKLLSWVIDERKSIIKPDGKVIIEPKFSPSRHRSSSEAIGEFKDLEYKIKTDYPGYERYKIGDSHRYIIKKKVLLIVLLMFFIVYGAYLVITPEGNYSPFINGASECYYENCEKYKTCSDEVANILKTKGTLKIRGVEPINLGWGTLIYYNNRINTGGIDYLDRVLIKYMTRQPINEQKEIVERFIKGERLLEANNTKISNIPVVGCSEEHRGEVKRLLESIEIDKPYGYQYLENVKEIEVTYNLDACGYASIPDEKIKINFNSTLCKTNCSVYCYNQKARISLLINEACKVSSLKRFYIKNEYEDYKTCRAVETFCAEEAGTFEFDDRNLDEFLESVCE